METSVYLFGENKQSVPSVPSAGNATGVKRENKGGTTRPKTFIPVG